MHVGAIQGALAGSVFVPMVILGALPAVASDLPNLIGMTVKDATYEVARLGVNARVEINLTGGACPSAVGERIIEIGQICAYWPINTRSFSPSNRTIRVTVQQKDPRHGNLGSKLEWHLMPNVIGMSADEARAELARVGLANQSQTEIVRVEEHSCSPDRVCRTYPGANERSGVNSGRILYVGAATE